jgi:hypothetical protein
MAEKVSYETIRHNTSLTDFLAPEELNNKADE